LLQAVQKGSKAWWRRLFRPDGFLRQEMLTIYLMLVSSTTFFGYAFTPIEPVAQTNLVVSVLAVCLLAVVRVRAIFVFIVHAVTALTALLIVYTAMYTGGINSTAVVWLNVLSAPVLLMLGRAATLVWICIMMLAILGLTLMTWWGVVDSHVEVSSSVVTWAYLNHVLALLNLMMGVRIYEHLHKVQLRKLNQRNDELKATHEALIRAQAHKDEFVAAVGHELRTPMNAILGFNGVLHRELSDDPEQLAVVGHIRRSTEHLLQVVNDILDFSQLQAGKLRLNPVDYELRAVLDELQRRHGENALRKGLVLRMQCDEALPFRIHGDRQRLLQILNNLVDNASKFSTQGQVDVRMKAAGQWLRLEVQDRGCGIAQERQQYIFSRFEQADAQIDRTSGGTGLGLTLCEKLVKLHNGRIGVDSQLGQGTMFWLELPLKASKDQSLSRSTRDNALTDESLNILVVDDNPVNLMVAQLQLQNSWPQAQITTLDTGPAALDLLAVQTFDFALIDMIMPDMDGMQVTQHIHQRFPGLAERMPIFALTANTNPVERDRCLAAGMHEVLHKPMDMTILKATIEPYVRRAREGKL
jgi:signal transduction histidine kinase/CheY-like chemotaxis protein